MRRRLHLPKHPAHRRSPGFWRCAVLPSSKEWSLAYQKPYRDEKLFSGFGWYWYKKAQTWSVALGKYLHLTAAPGVYCLLQLYSSRFEHFVQRQNSVTMFDLLKSRWMTADSAPALVLALPANTSRRSRLPLLALPYFHTGYRIAEIVIASI